MGIPEFRRLIRFVPKSDGSKIFIGEPRDESTDVGLALRKGQQVEAFVWTGSSTLSPGSKTEHFEAVERVLSPLASHEVGTIRCIGLNVC
jgi:hypothetical protein